MVRVDGGVVPPLDDQFHVARDVVRLLALDARGPEREPAPVVLAVVELGQGHDELAHDVVAPDGVVVEHDDLELLRGRRVDVRREGEVEDLLPHGVQRVLAVARLAARLLVAAGDVDAREGVAALGLLGEERLVDGREAPRAVHGDAQLVARPLLEQRPVVAGEGVPGLRVAGPVVDPAVDEEELALGPVAELAARVAELGPAPAGEVVGLDGHRDLAEEVVAPDLVVVLDDGPQFEGLGRASVTDGSKSLETRHGRRRGPSRGPAPPRRRRAASTSG